MPRLPQKLPLYSPRFKPALSLESGFWDKSTVDLSFSIIGGYKCGTTWLNRHLNDHAAIHLPPEQNFFTQFADRGWQSFEALYTSRPETHLGDHSNANILDRNLPKILKARFPNIKLIVVVRDPVQRAFSHYGMDLAKGVLPTGTTFVSALESPTTYSYYDLGLYSKYLTTYLHYFERREIRVILFEDLVKNPQQTVNETLAFLGLDAIILSESARINTWEEVATERSSTVVGIRSLVRSNTPPFMRESLRKQLPLFLRTAGYFTKTTRPVLHDKEAAWLGKMYQSSNQELADLFSLDLSGWAK